MSGSPGGWTQNKANDGQDLGSLGSRWFKDRALIQPGHLRGGVSKDGQVCVCMCVCTCVCV